MTTFKALFNQMGKKKRRSVYLLALLQLVAASVFALWALFSNGDAFSSQDKPIAWFVMVFTFAPFADMAYVVLSAWQNEKEYSSQTWRLVPISSSKFYLANILSAFVNGLYLVLIQIGMGIITFLPALLSKDVRTNIWEINQAISKSTHAGNFWQKFFESFPIVNMLSTFIAFLLFAVLVYSIVTTLNLSSRTITDFLPDKHSKLIRFVIMIILIFIFIFLSDNLINLLNQLRWGENSNSLLAFSESNLMVALIDVALGAVNIWLLKNFHEGK
ncbi:ABC transporter permease [Lactobacillus gasseri]|uniref:ABC transporter permease n=1 Tax=Lactobacillus gasseri TaxID=1596 RepID=UPI0030F28094